MFRPAYPVLLLTIGLSLPVLVAVWPGEQSYGAPPRRRPSAEMARPPQPPAIGGRTVDSDDPPAPPTEEHPLSPRIQKLREQVRQAIDLYRQHPITTRDHTPWETFHWILAYNVDAEIYTQGPGGEKSNAVGWLCFNRPCQGQKLLAIENGRPAGQYGVGLEGHKGQFMAILGQSRVMIDYPMMINNKQYKVADLVEECKLSCESGEDKELTFLLIGLSHYLHPNAVWKNREGETWSIPRLIREEISKPIKGAACGGTHRLMGLSYAVRKRQQHELPITGEFARAQMFVNEYVQYLLRLQNTDGSFSTEWFTGRGARPDIDRRLQTTGHMLEWLVFTLPEERLQDAPVTKAVDYVSRILIDEQEHEWKIGHLGHSLRALSLYERRAFKQTVTDVTEVARRTDQPATKPMPESEKHEEDEEKAVTKPADAGDKQTGTAETKPDDDPPPVPPASFEVDP